MVFYSKYNYCALSENTNMGKIWAPPWKFNQACRLFFHSFHIFTVMGSCEFLFDLNFLFLELALPLGPEFPAVSLR